MPTWKNNLKLVKLTVFVHNYIVEITENATHTLIEFLQVPKKPPLGFTQFLGSCVDWHKLRNIQS